MKKTLILCLILFYIVISGCSTQKTEPQTYQQAEVTPTETQQTATQPIPSPSTTGLGTKKDVEISGFEFDPNTITVPKGASVVWTNKDSVRHTIVSDSGDEINSDTLSQGESYVHAFNTAGIYEYHCGIHPSMKGKVIVE